MIVDLQAHDDYVLVKMQSPPVNALNPDMFDALRESFDRARTDFPRRPLILTGSRDCFSAGLDLLYTMPLFEKGTHGDVRNWFYNFRDMINALLFYPWPTVAAVNGHAVAGGLLLAICCDRRIATSGEWNIGMNEVHVGIPMPTSFLEILKLRLPPSAAFEVGCIGRFFTMEESLQMDIFHAAVDAGELMPRAVKEASSISPDVIDAYAQSKAMFMAPTRRWIESEASFLEESTFELAKSDSLIAARTRVVEKLKKQ